MYIPSIIWGFQSDGGTPKIDPIKMDDLEVPPF